MSATVFGALDAKHQKAVQRYMVAALEDLGAEPAADVFVWLKQATELLNQGESVALVSKKELIALRRAQKSRGRKKPNRAAPSSPNTSRSESKQAAHSRKASSSEANRHAAKAFVAQIHDLEEELAEIVQNRRACNSLSAWLKAADALTSDAAHPLLRPALEQGLKGIGGTMPSKRVKQAFKKNLLFHARRRRERLVDRWRSTYDGPA